MAMIYCPECGKKISDKAIACIHCGFTIREWLTQQPAGNGNLSEPDPGAAREPVPQISPDPAAPDGTMKKNDRRNRILAIAAVLIVAGVGLFFAIRAIVKPDYYKEGLKVTQLLGELLDNEDYAALIGQSYLEAADRIKDIRKNDFSSPVSVYSLQITDKEKFVRKYMLKDNTEALQHWNNLPADMREQLKNNYSISTFFMVYNSLAGISDTLLSSLYLVNYVSDSLANGEPKEYLYVFSNDCAILVSFGNKHAAGQIVNIAAMPENALSDKRTFEEYGITVEQVK